jgi:hypothetical protein
MNYGRETEETITLYNIGFNYFEEKMIFIHQGIFHICFGDIKRHLTKIINEPEKTRIGFMIALRLYLEHGNLIGSPFEFYTQLKTDYGHFPFFEDIHTHFYKDHSTCPCNREGQEGEFEEPTLETTVEKFTLKEILYLVSGIIYHNSQVDNEIEADSDFIEDFLGFWTPTIAQLDTVAN